MVITIYYHTIVTIILWSSLSYYHIILLLLYFLYDYYFILFYTILYYLILFYIIYVGRSYICGLSRICGSMSMVLCGSGCGFTWVGVGGTCTCRRGVVVSKLHMWVNVECMGLHAWVKFE